MCPREATAKPSLGDVYTLTELGDPCALPLSEAWGGHGERVLMVSARPWVWLRAEPLRPGLAPAAGIADGSALAQLVQRDLVSCAGGCLTSRARINCICVTQSPGDPTELGRGV